MKPIFLEIEGVNSFEKKQTIDFEKLLQGGIFGIFGNTGSGKSSILDAITLALYGYVERAGKIEEFINKRTNRAAVAFRFASGGSACRVYEVVRELKKGKTGNIIPKAALYEIKTGEKIPIAEGAKLVGEKIYEIIGLDIKDFQKCIALPQGEFAAFVKSTRAERLNIIARLFSLELFGDGIYKKVKEKCDELSLQIQIMQNDLARYDEIDAAKIDALKSESNALTQELNAVMDKSIDAEMQLSKKNALYSKCVELERCRERIAQAQKLSSDIEALKISLSRAETAHALIGELDAAENSAKTAREKKSESVRLNNESENVLNELKNIDLKKVEDEMSELSEKISNLKLCQSDVLRADNMEKERKKLLSAYREKEDELQIAHLREKKLSEEIKKIAEQTPPEQDMSEEYSNLVSAALCGEYREALDYFSGKRKELELLADGSEAGRAYGAVLKQVKERESHYEKKLNSISHVGDFDAALVSLKVKRENAKKRERFLDNINACRLELAEIIGKQEKLLSEKNTLSRQGREIKDELIRLNTKINAVSGAEEYFSYLQTCITRLQNATNKSYALKEKSEKLKVKADELSKKSAALAIAGKDEEERYAAQMSQLQSKMQVAGFESAQAIRAAAMHETDQKKAVEKIDNHNAALLAANVKAQELSDELEGVRVSWEDVDKAKIFSAQLKAKELNLREILALKNKELKDTEKSLSEKMKKSAEYGIIKNKSHTAETLLAIVKNKQLLEFACEEYLKEIASEASALLSSLTNGRYFLVYDYDFYVEDNLSAGERRPVNSLSGGETFLVSLSLAIALSNAIYSKAEGMVEFFFLDEGFGTLDDELVDTVLDCLEKLKKDRFSIGLISHVQQLKQRINSKILVLGADAENGSTLKVIY